MKFQFRYLLLLLIIATSCSTSKLIVQNGADRELYLTVKGVPKGKIEAKDSLVFFQKGSMNGMSITANNAPFYGNISYKKNPAISSSDKTLTLERFIVDESQNAQELNQKFDFTSSGKKIVSYSIIFGEGFSGGAPGNFGYLKITSNEDDIAIYIDDDRAGTLRKDPYIRKVPIGKHTVKAVKDFYLPIIFEIEVTGVDVYPYHLTLNPVNGWQEKVSIEEQTMQGRGNLIIVTEKNNYKVIFENREMVPPFVLKNVPAGEYRIKVVSPTFEKDLKITVNEGKANLVDIDEEL